MWPWLSLQSMDVWRAPPQKTCYCLVSFSTLLCGWQRNWCPRLSCMLGQRRICATKNGAIMNLGSLSTSKLPSTELYCPCGSQRVPFEATRIDRSAAKDLNEADLRVGLVELVSVVQKLDLGGFHSTAIRRWFSWIFKSSQVWLTDLTGYSAAHKVANKNGKSQLSQFFPNQMCVEKPWVFKLQVQVTGMPKSFSWSPCAKNSSRQTKAQALENRLATARLNRCWRIQTIQKTAKKHVEMLDLAYFFSWLKLSDWIHFLKISGNQRFGLRTWVTSQDRQGLETSPECKTQFTTSDLNVLSLSVVSLDQFELCSQGIPWLQSFSRLPIECMHKIQMLYMILLAFIYYIIYIPTYTVDYNIYIVLFEYHLAGGLAIQKDWTPALVLVSGSEKISTWKFGPCSKSKVQQMYQNIQKNKGKALISSQEKSWIGWCRCRIPCHFEKKKKNRRGQSDPGRGHKVKSDKIVFIYVS